MWRTVAISLLPLLEAGLPADYPSVKIHGVDGLMDMPLFGIGTWLYNDSVTEHAVSTAFKLGYRHVDTANDYGNQLGVAKALKASGIPRDEFFVTTKIPGGLNASASEQALNEDLEQLGLDYVDLMLVHWPAGMNAKGIPNGPKQRQESWLALEKFAKAGKAKAIGVSHYCERQFEDILKVATLPIAVNQVQYHVGMGAESNMETDYKSWMTKHTLYESFSPFCGPCTPPDNTVLFNGELVTKIGKAHGVSGGQVSLRWLVQQGIPVIPKSDDPAHIKQNMEIFGFNLTTEEMAELSAATTPGVGGGPSATSSGDCEIQAEEIIV